MENFVPQAIDGVVVPPGKLSIVLSSTNTFVPGVILSSPNSLGEWYKCGSC